MGINELRRGNTKTSPKYRKLGEELALYNSVNEIHWRIFSNVHFYMHTFLSGIRTVTEAQDEQELLLLQEGANNLAQYLFNKYLRVSHPVE